MIHYLLINARGEIAQRGLCQTRAEVPAIDGCAAEIIQADDARRPAAATAATYRDMRRMSYPGVGDQLDALWKVIDAMGLPSESDAAALLDRINAVKIAHPKA